MSRDIDTTRPHTGRVYDYLLGGTQNFAADRQAADALAKLVPGVRAIAQLNRWFLQLVAARWAAEGYTRVLDLGSGLPTQGHFNEQIPKGRILFSDHDALSVTYGQQLLKDNPNMGYLHADMRQPQPLLDAAAQFFADNRQLAIGFIGLSYFLPDEDVRTLARTLHAFCAPGSVLAMSYFLPVPESGPSAELLKVYTRMLNTRFYMRTPELVAELLAPWRITEQDSVETWLDVPHLLTAEDRLSNQFKLQGLFAVY